MAQSSLVWALLILSHTPGFLYTLSITNISYKQLRIIMKPSKQYGARNPSRENSNHDLVVHLRPILNGTFFRQHHLDIGFLKYEVAFYYLASSAQYPRGSKHLGVECTPNVG